jgi:hypothetical protein
LGIFWMMLASLNLYSRKIIEKWEISRSRSPCVLWITSLYHLHGQLCKDGIKNKITVLFSIDYVVRDTDLIIQFLGIYVLPNFGASTTDPVFWSDKLWWRFTLMSEHFPLLYIHCVFTFTSKQKFHWNAV